MKIVKFGTVSRDKNGNVLLKDFVISDCTDAEARDDELIASCVARHILSIVGQGDTAFTSLNAERVVNAAIRKARKFNAQ